MHHVTMIDGMKVKPKGGSDLPVFVIAGPISVSTPQQNANGVLIGNNSASNWDANMKFNTAQGGNFGIMSVNLTAGSMMFDNLEGVDGVINEFDIKSSPSIEF